VQHASVAGDDATARFQLRCLLGDRNVRVFGRLHSVSRPFVTSGLNFTQNHRFEFATGVAAGAVE